MIGLNDADVIGLIRAVARLQNQLAEAEQELYRAVTISEWLIAEARCQIPIAEQKVAGGNDERS